MRMFSLSCGVTAVALVILGYAFGASRSAKPLASEQITLVQRYEALPEGVKAALVAADLDGMTVVSRSDGEVASAALRALIKAGARRSSGKSADLIINEKPEKALLGRESDLIVSDSAGQVLLRRKIGYLETPEMVSEVSWAVRGVSSVLGQERRRKLLEGANTR